MRSEWLERIHGSTWRTHADGTPYHVTVVPACEAEAELEAVVAEPLHHAYDAAKKPKAPGKPERMRCAWDIGKTPREVFADGVSAELAGCARVRDIIAEIRLPQQARRWAGCGREIADGGGTAPSPSSGERHLNGDEDRDRDHGVRKISGMPPKN